jgi:hypothetical protein
LGQVRRGHRELDDGQVISWHLTYPNMQLGSGLVPFLIDWGQSRHPSETAPGGVQLVDLWAEHPEPSAIQGMLEAPWAGAPGNPGRAAGTDRRVRHAPRPG